MALITDPGNYSNSDDAEASDINNRFATLYTEINGLLSNANISASAAIAETKLDLRFDTRELQFRLGVSADKWSGRKAMSVIRANDLNTIAISLPIISSMLTPASDPWGLEYDSTLGVLWHSDSTAEIIYRINTNTGAVLSSFTMTGIAPYGVTHDGTNLWIAGDTTNEIYRVDTLGVILSSFDAPSTSPRGLTYLNNYLYHSDANTDVVYRLNTLGTVLAQFNAPVGNPQGVATNGVDLFIPHQADSRVYKLNTAGTILASFTNPLDLEVSDGLAPRGATYDGAHLWMVQDNPDLLIKCMWAGFTRAPFVQVSESTGHAVSQPVLFADKESFAWANHQYTTLTVIASFEVSNQAALGIAFKKSADRTVDDYYVMEGGTRVLRYRRGTFQSSFSLNGITAISDIVFGDNYMWALSDTAAPDNIIYQIAAAAYDIDSLSLAAVSSFNIDAAAGYSDTAIGIGYDDSNPRQHALWVCESGARNVARISTAALSIYSSFTAAAAITPPQSVRQVGRDLYILEGGASALLYKLSTTGTALSSWSLPATGTTDYLGLDWDERTMWIVGNDDGAGAQDDKLFNMFTHVAVHAEDIN